MNAAAEVAARFALPGAVQQIEPVTQGYINDTWQVRCVGGRAILQRINRSVFRQPQQVMENILWVTAHLRERIHAAGGDPTRETLTLIPLRAGGWFCVDSRGEFWRMYAFIEGAEPCQQGAPLEKVRQAAAAFGRFQALLEDLPGEQLHETIPGFHHTPQRLTAFRRAVEGDVAGRLSAVRGEVQMLLERSGQAGRVIEALASGNLPRRVTHNDTKLDNVLLDSVSGQGLCVIDLDTVMPGSLVYDFGDMVRMGASAAAEDEPELDKVALDLARFKQLALGYLGEVRGLLAPAERDLLVFGAWLITFEQALRFLGDYLNGDTYYRVAYAEHNLVRAQTQIKMLAEFERNRERMEAVVLGITG
ncbi:MAG: aminoglycoside phosphotransferase family protein [Anaerolineaceae bacterium]|nr:aminoglycoside phosphotransferase family protein [Anaerolineaceae bacterium]